jgi:two-component system response regulator RpfG
VPYETVPSSLLVYVVDDEPLARDVNARLIESLGNVRVETFGSGEDALAAAIQSPMDFLVTDYRMPGGMDGIELIQAVRMLPECTHVPICMITSLDDIHVQRSAWAAGATDFTTKPLDSFGFKVRCTNLLKLREQQHLLQGRAKYLQNLYLEQSSHNRAVRREAIMLLARAGESRDTETGQHLMRMAKYSRIVASALSLDKTQCDLIESAAPLHDIGKIAIQDDILRAKRQLTAIEWETMQTHTVRGYEILRSRISDWQEIQMGAMIARSHHEKWNGEGYPEGLAGESIPLPARIIAVGDAYDALTSRRPYKAPWTHEQAKEYIVGQRGIHFDPACVDAFFSRESEILAVAADFPDCGAGSDDAVTMADSGS